MEHLAHANNVRVQFVGITKADYNGKTLDIQTPNRNQKTTLLSINQRSLDLRVGQHDAVRRVLTSLSDKQLTTGCMQSYGKSRSLE